MYTAIHAEWQKLCRSGIYWLLLGAALFMPLLTTLIHFFMPLEMLGGALDSLDWDGWIKSSIGGFAGFFYPLFLVLITVRIVYLEHRSDTWKLMETQPVAKWRLFFAKWLTAAALSGLLLLCTYGFTLLGGALLEWGRTELKLGESQPDVGLHVHAALRIWIASFGLIALQYFLSLLWKSFAAPMGAGVIGIIAGSILTGFGLAQWWPWTSPSLSAKAYDGATGQWLMRPEVLSLVWCALFLWMAYQYFTYRSVKEAFVRKPARAAALGILTLTAVILVWWTLLPRIAKPHHRTVMTGQLIGAPQVDTFYLLRSATHDTVTTGSVVNGKFHAVIPDTLPAAPYLLVAGKLRTTVYLGTNDSVYAKIEWKGDRSNIDISGTRTAENDFLPRLNNSLWQAERSGRMMPNDYVLLLRKLWKEEQEEAADFKTGDGWKLRPDFLQGHKALLAAEFRQLTDRAYPAGFAVYHPNESLKYPTSLESLRREWKEASATAPQWPLYWEAIHSRLAVDGEGLDSTYFAALDEERLSAPSKDAVLNLALMGGVFRLRDSARREGLAQLALSKLQDPALRRQLAARLDRVRNLRRGQPAAPFAAATLTGRPSGLSSFTGRYVVVDVWATWCGPCLEEAPLFEELAERYTSTSLAFVSLSVDAEKGEWIRKTAAKKGRVLQLHANDLNAFSQAYNVQTIPRFLLIDPKGNLLNPDLPPPSEGMEAELLRDIPRLQPEW